jgi:hypothetical protein
VFNELIEPVTPSILVNLLFCVVLVALFEIVNKLKSVLILPLSDSSDVNLPDALEVNVLKLEVKVYFGAKEAVSALVEPPEILPLITPTTVKLPETSKLLEISAEEDTDKLPDMCASNIFI